MSTGPRTRSPRTVIPWQRARPFTIHLKKITPDGRATLIWMSATPTDPDPWHRWVWILRSHDPAEDQHLSTPASRRDRGRDAVPAVTG
jgi:hypothetical protein